jgi:16S rRNA A1518/A1519 N6-dimethyltransferase RsmA/KsgA/DIM1 with predicted DNA glycosylase/AP lyase activity
MGKIVADWHKHFTQQAGWTTRVRQYLLNRSNLPGDSKVLEVGCGSGALLSDPLFDGYDMVGLTWTWIAWHIAKNWITTRN